MIHQATILHGLSTLRGYWVYAKINRWLWPMAEILKWSYIPYRLSHYWWRLVVIDILNRGIMISYGIEAICPLGWSKRHVIMKFVVAVIPLIKFNICFLKFKYISWLNNRGICNSRIGEVILMGWVDSTTLLY